MGDAKFIILIYHCVVDSESKTLFLDLLGCGLY